MSLFDELRRLHRKTKFEMEDFHTEIVAQVLRNSAALTIEWLRGIGAVDSSISSVISVTTQEKFAALEEDEPGSRVDMVIRLSADNLRQIVFVESKIDSGENPGQLPKYAGVIAKREGFGRSNIIYITRDFETARAAPIITTRWRDFYYYLKGHLNADGLATQLKLFMEEYKMSGRDQFTAIDSVALSNFLSARALMHETLWTGVHERFQRILGSVSSEKKCMTQLRDFDRYIMYVAIGPAYDFNVQLGYWLPNSDPAEPSWIGVTLESNPKSKIRKDVISVFRDFRQKNAGWADEDLDNEKEWATIFKGTSLPQFMSQPNHVKAIREYFSGLLDELKRFRSTYPKLPWKSRSVDADEQREE